MADYLGPPPHAVGAARVAVDPEAVKVDPKLFPKYRVASLATPPSWKSTEDSIVTIGNGMTEILPTDEWFVRNIVGDLYLIESPSYNARQWQYLKRFKSGANYVYTIFLSKEGEVSGGWMLLKNPKYVVLSSERRTYLVAEPWGNIGWENIRFEKIQ